MNQKQKIIISVTGIFLVLLILLGLTYAYFLTQIVGNTNNKSISVTTTELSLKYDDGNGILSSSTKIVPGTTIATKTFSVENNGDTVVDSYAVILENLNITYANTINDVVAGARTYLESPNDMKLLITCKSSISGKTCNGLDGVLPTTNDILLTNSINVGEVQNYELTLIYSETKVDQSSDMNKIIEGKINIIDTKSTIDIEGIVINYEAGDFVKTNSVERISNIDKNGRYKIVGLEPDDHSIKVINSNNEEKINESISIVKGNTASVVGNVITFTDDTRTVTIDIENTGLNISDEIKEYNPYIKGTLAYEIINKAQISKKENSSTDAQFRTNPLTIPGKSMSCKKTYEELEPVTQDLSELLDTYVGYTDEYIFDENNGFTLVDLNVVKVSEVYTELEGKYLAHDKYFDENGSKKMIHQNADTITKVISVTSDTITSQVLKIKSTNDSVESTLSTTLDDYGTSYYYRGGVTDNFVNFNNMCWRIIRIQGDGSIKLALASANGLCETSGVLTNTSAFIGTANYGYDSNKKADFNNIANRTSSMKYKFDNWINTNFSDNIKDKMKLSQYCIGDVSTLYNSSYNVIDTTEASSLSTVYYSAVKRLLNDREPSLICSSSNKTLETYAATLTADEIVFAGAYKIGIKNSTHYLYQNAKNNFLLLSVAGYFSQYDGVTASTQDSSLNVGPVTGSIYIRPVITLKKDLYIKEGTNGTQMNPYVIE